MELLRPIPTRLRASARAGARIVGRALIGLLVAAGLVLGFGSAASAGGWAVTTLDEVPVPTSGEAVTVGFTILQHGVTPADLDEGVGIEITGADGTVEVFPATQRPARPLRRVGRVPRRRRVPLGGAAGVVR